MKKYFPVFLCIVFIFLFFLENLNAQRDSEFWFAVPDNTATSSSQRDFPILVRISSFDVETRVSLVQPANSSFASFEDIIPPNTSISLTIANSRQELDGLECRPGGQIVPYGLLLVSSAPITASLENSSPQNPDIFSLKGRNALGKSFIVPAQNEFLQFDGYNPIPNTFLVCATKDNTQITIIPSQNLAGGFAAGVPFSRNLNKGEIFVAQAVGLQPENHLSGSIVEATKDVVLMVNDDTVYPSSGGADLMADQSIPNRILGQTYIVARGFLNFGDRVFIHGTEDNTNIYRDGNSAPLANIDKGDVHNLILDTPNNSTFIESDKPVLIYHMSGWQQPGAAVIPPTECTGSSRIAFTRAENTSFYIMVFTESGHEGDFIINGNPDLLKASDFDDVPGTSGSWKVARKSMGGSIPVGSGNIIENTSGLFHLGTINGDNWSCRYGFFSNFASLDLGPDQTFCPGDTVVLDAGGVMDSYAWFKIGFPDDTLSTNATIEISDSGFYYCNTIYGSCTPSDTIHLSLSPFPIPDLGHDTTVCGGGSVTFNPGSFSNYLWFDGSTNSEYTCDTIRTIWVKITDGMGCQNSDTVQMWTYPKPTGTIIIYHD